MKVAYADPPYLGMCGRYDHHHPDGRCWDDLSTHHALIERLSGYDAWALSLHSVSLRAILPLCPEDVRVGAWVKPFAVFRPGVNPAYAWEPVIFRGRKMGKERDTVRDWVSANITMQRGTVGAKPETFTRWLFDVLGMGPDDEFVDLFEGSGGVFREWERWRAQGRLALDTVRDDGVVAGGAVDAIARSGPAGGTSEEDS